MSIHFDTIADGVTLCEPSDVWIIASCSVVEVTIGIELLACELAGVIAGTCLIAYRTEDIALVPYQHILIVIG